MRRSRVWLVGLLLSAVVGPASAQEPRAPSTLTTPVKDVRIVGARELRPKEVMRAGRLEIGQPIPATPESIAESIARRYQDDGYLFAKVTAGFEASTGVLTITIDEGVIDRVEFVGVSEPQAKSFVHDFALRAGDVFRRDRAVQALDALLQPTRGAIRPARLAGSTTLDHSLEARRPGVFDLRDVNGEHVLMVGLREPAGRFRLVPDLGDREDWFSSVDGFVPSMGMGVAVFDHDNFNHAYVAGHISFKTATSDVGYSLGFEKPVFTRTKLFLGGELYDLTATDDNFRVSPLEASLAAIGPRLSYHDFYRRRGIQLGGAVRVHPQVEFVFAWRDEREEALPVASDFSFWNSDEAFRPNVPAAPGRLSAIIVGASVSGESFELESLDATYRRHQLTAPFGAVLNELEGRHPRPVWRVDWTSEISSPGALNSDFDFSRSIVAARLRAVLSPHQEIGVRAIGGWSTGVLPPQSLFALGGIGTVHGYEFKQAFGDTMGLANFEYALGWRTGLQLVAFLDTGRVTYRTVTTSTPWMNGVGFGISLAQAIRVDFGYKLDDVPGSLQVLVRFGRTF